MCIWEGSRNSVIFCSGQLITLTFPRKNFDRHFQVSICGLQLTQYHLTLSYDLQESRHAFGMRALGLPNTKHFHEITRIEDALSRES